MRFYNTAHKKFYEKVLMDYQLHNGTIDTYSASFFYLMGICNDTRKNFKTLFNMEQHVIIPNGLHASWQTGTSIKICRLAFNLWNGFCIENDTENQEKEFSKEYAVDNLFCCSYAEYFFEAIRLRYPDYCIIDN